jgi:hypothetical protein
LAEYLICSFWIFVQSEHKNAVALLEFRCIKHITHWKFVVYSPLLSVSLLWITSLLKWSIKWRTLCMSWRKLFMVLLMSSWCPTALPEILNFFKNRIEARPGLFVIICEVHWRLKFMLSFHYQTNSFTLTEMHGRVNFRTTVCPICCIRAP